MKSLTVLNSDVQTMSSREIAELTGKRHDNVMRDIRKMVEELSADSSLSWHCESSTYLDQQGKEREMYELDKDTTITLISGYDVKLRMKIIKRWQELEAQTVTMPEIHDPSLAAHIKTLIELDQLKQRQLRYEAEQQRLAEQQNRIESEVEQQGRKLQQIETATDHFTIIGWHRYVNQSGSLPLADAARMGKQATKFCMDNEVEMGQVPDPRFGTVRTYPKWVLDDLFTTVQ